MDFPLISFSNYMLLILWNVINFCILIFFTYGNHINYEKRHCHLFRSNLHIVNFFFCIVLSRISKALLKINDKSGHPQFAHPAPSPCWAKNILSRDDSWVSHFLIVVISCVSYLCMAMIHVLGINLNLEIISKYD